MTGDQRPSIAELLGKLYGAWESDESRMNLMHLCEMAANEIARLQAAVSDAEERCAQRLEWEEGLDVFRWISLWERDGRTIDRSLAIGIYHEALQDARQAIRALSKLEPPNTSGEQTQSQEGLVP